MSHKPASRKRFKPDKANCSQVNGMEVPLLPVERMLRRSSMRVSDEAVEELAKLLEEIAADIAAEAAANAKRGGRKTVGIADVEAAKRKLL